MGGVKSACKLSTCIIVTQSEKKAHIIKCIQIATILKGYQSYILLIEWLVGCKTTECQQNVFAKIAYVTTLGDKYLFLRLGHK